MTFAKIGVLGFGGPAGQIALMHREIVEERRWIAEERFLHALNFCMLLPGPEAQQLATYTGWLLRGWKGGVVAGSLFVLPGFLVMILLSTAYMLWGETTLLSGIFDGLKAAVLVIVAEALFRVMRRSLKTWLAAAVAVLSFLALFVFKVPFPAVVLCAGLAGAVASRMGKGKNELSSPAVDQGARGATTGAAMRTLGIWGGLWLLPFVVLAMTGIANSVFWDISAFFSKMAVVTFGGAYAVLSYVGQQAVDHYHWLQPGEMLDGLGLAETTPGPLVLVLTYVGFVAGYRLPGDLAPIAGGLAGAFLATWVTFVPCFLWIFLGAPWIERLRNNKIVAGSLAMISAAVAGVIANLGLWFGLHVIFKTTSDIAYGPLRMTLPHFDSFDFTAFAMSIFAALLLFRLKLGTLKLIGLMGFLGGAMRIFGIG